MMMRVMLSELEEYLANKEDNKKLYDEIVSLSVGFHQKYGVSKVEVQIAQESISLIESSRTMDKPQPGDTVELYTRYGDYFGNAYLQTCMDNNKGYVCERPSAPYFINSDGNPIFTASGGAWQSIDLSQLQYRGRHQRLFWEFGREGACADGGFYYKAMVNIWEYKEPDPLYIHPLYGPLYTKEWTKRRFSYCKKPNPHDVFFYKIIGDGIAFRCNEEFGAWLQAYRGYSIIEASGFVVFHYKLYPHCISKKRWDTLPYMKDTRLINGGVQVIKVRYDDVQRIIHEYRFSNSGDNKYPVFAAEKGIKL